MKTPDRLGEKRCRREDLELVAGRPGPSRNGGTLSVMTSLLDGGIAPGPRRLPA